MPKTHNTNKQKKEWLYNRLKRGAGISGLDIQIKYGLDAKLANEIIETIKSKHRGWFDSWNKEDLLKFLGMKEEPDHDRTM